ncbi:gephyrin-like molybdotransferase receptor GlpR [Streptomyces humi]|uniref:divisome protein SepX/GlpR n=1 Tax=Streptomyces humi TaxID=1428620 RepID=UPI0006287B32|nr:gephyrin-like molybdotransferase receptor GlpR [Streptomyces humi]
MSSSGLIYAVIVGAWAAYLVPMWLRRQDELNEARPTERFSTAIRLLSGRAGMERRYARDLRARSASEGEQGAGEADAVTDSVDVRAFAMPPTRRQVRADAQPERVPETSGHHEPARDRQAAPTAGSPSAQARQGSGTAASGPAQAPASAPAQASASVPAQASASAPDSARKRVPAARRAPSAQTAAARAQRSKALARRRRTTVLLFVAFTLGAIVAAVGGLAFLWAPGVPAVMLSTYIAYLRTQERRRFAYQMDRRQAEAAAQRLRERQPRRRAPLDPGAAADEPDEGPAAGTDPGLSALAADRRALVEQTDHAEWVDQQRERQRKPGQGDSWDPVPVPLPTYVTAPVAPRATSDVDLGAPDAWSSARSSSVAPEQESRPAAPEAEAQEPATEDDRPAEADGRTDARRAASARRARERGRTPLFDQYEDGERPRAANE